MKCAVLNCNSQTQEKECSFFSFPLNVELSNKWVKFCRRKKPFKHRTSLICMKHFKKEDIQNGLEYEMGFATKRILKRGVLPTIFADEFTNPERKERAMQRENKRIVAELIKKYDAEHTCAGNTNNIAMVEETSMESMESVDIINERNASLLLDMNNAIETPTSLEPFLEAHRVPFVDFEVLEMKLEERQKEIVELRQENKRQEKEIAAVKHKLKVMQHEVQSLEKRVILAESEKKSIEDTLGKVFSKTQIAILKFGTKSRAWSASDMDQANFIYSINRKIYNFLLKRGYPMPSIRTIQRYLKTNVPTVHLEDHCYTADLL